MLGFVYCTDSVVGDSTVRIKQLNISLQIHVQLNKQNKFDMIQCDVYLLEQLNPLFLVGYDQLVFVRVTRELTK